jgi:adenosine deaminase
MQSLYGNATVSPQLAARLRAMPKVELHVHLEGATDALTVWTLAQRNGVSLPAATLEEWRGFYAFRDFNHFIEVYTLAASCMRTPEDFVFMIERFGEQQVQHNVRYCEVFLSATFLVVKFSPDDILLALEEGARRVEARSGVKIAFIPDIARHEPDSRHAVLDFALRGRERGIFIGLGLGGIERGYPPELFADVYAEARQQQVHVVAHAGETDGPASVWGAIRTLHAERIGHGVRSVDDPELLAFLRETQIPLEVSPHSNYALGVVGRDQPHPVRTLVDHGVLATVNSDDPPMFGTDLTQEYLLLARQGFSWAELWRLNTNAIDASFLAPDEKAAMHAEWDAWAAQHASSSGEAV